MCPTNKNKLSSYISIFVLLLLLLYMQVLVAVLLFIIPSKKQEGERLMDWNECKRLPWNLILLLGAGFALADGVQSSGLAEVLSRALDFLQNAPYLAIVPLVTLMCSIITEFITSNDATATLLTPLLYHMARTMHVHPLLLMVPGAISTEFAYWLPTSTPSNVVGFATGYIEIKDMLKVGVPLKFAAIAVLSILMPTLGKCFSLSLSAFIIHFICFRRKIIDRFEMCLGGEEIIQ